ncbi:hypothetical protein [Streptomyces sp. NBC_00439]|uniref:hypothetical protein n=1 Tax=Streptomyces sp. NBC_00439 TaxID=2903650 RepID=UPI0022560FBE|nr:hypothetical protein [Streptomyces sp. NBC_00439]MCX5103683.1 hypothetical protein [Streptomyces sp. NBC_00439]
MTVPSEPRHRDIEPPHVPRDPSEPPWALWLGSDLERLYQIFAEGQLWLSHAYNPEGQRLPPSHDETVNWVRSELVRLGLPFEAVNDFENDMSHIRLEHKPDASLWEAHTRIARRMDRLMNDVASRLDGVDRAMYDIGVALARFFLYLRMVDDMPPAFPPEAAQFMEVCRAELRRSAVLLRAGLTRLWAAMRTDSLRDSVLNRELRRLGTVLDEGTDQPEQRRRAYRQILQVQKCAGLFQSPSPSEDGAVADPPEPEEERDLRGRPRADTVAELQAARDRADAATPASTDPRLPVAMFKELRTQYRMSLGPYDLDTLMVSAALAYALLVASEKGEAVDVALDTAATAAHRHGERHPHTAVISALLLPMMLRSGDPGALEQFLGDRIMWLVSEDTHGWDESLLFARALALRELSQAGEADPSGNRSP